MLTKLYHTISSKKHQLFVLTDQALVSGVNFLVAILLTRYLGLETFGIYATAWLIVLFFSSIQQALIIAPLYTLYAKTIDKTEFITQSLNLQTLFSLLASICTLIITTATLFFYNTWELSSLLYTLPLATGAFLLQDFFRRKNFVEHKSATVFIADCFAYGLQPIAIFVLVYFNQLTITSFFTVITLLMGSVAIVQYILASKTNINSKTLKLFKRFWKFSRPLCYTALLQWFSGNYFIVFATGVLGPIALGIIRIAQNLMGLLHILFLALENLIPIQAANILTQKGIHPTLYFFKKSSIKTGGITLLILLLVALFRNQIITAIYGSEYLAYSYTIVFFCVIYLFVFLGTILRFVVRTFEVNRIVLENYIITGIVSFCSAHFLIANYQLEGVLAGLLIIQIISTLYISIRLARELKPQLS